MDISSLFFAILILLSPQAQAVCGDLLLSTGPLPTIGALPEEVLGRHAGLSGQGAELGKILSDLKITRVEFGSRFKVRGGWLRERVLVIKPFHYKRQADDILELAAVLFKAKQKQLRASLRPSHYLDELQAFALRLEAFVYPAMGVLAPERLPDVRRSFGFTGYLLKAMLGFSSSGWKLWPLSQARAVDHLIGEDLPSPGGRRALSVHFTVSRMLFAFYMSLSAVAISHLPQAYETAELLYRLRSEFAQLGERLMSEEGIAFDGRVQREKLIAIYESKLAVLERDALNASEASGEDLAVQIEQLRSIIASLNADLLAGQ